MPWIVVSLSLFATLFSTVSFVGVPGEAYQNGVLTFIRSMGYAVCTPLAVWLFLRFFYSTGQTFTAYEYLERRFDVRVLVPGWARAVANASTGRLCRPAKGLRICR